jgi:2-C-methyl-D-erythritol 4-phosphate cytidylyltransferase
MRRTTALIVAGGQGLRMQLDIRKQYLDIDGQPIISRTLQIFDQCEEISDICLVIPESDHDYCRTRIIDPMNLVKPCKLVSGGAERQNSVYNGLLSLDLKPDDIVVIHDGVRPFVTDYHIRACIEGAVISGASILAIPLSDTLKLSDSDGNIKKTIDREMMWAAQTPQVFQFNLIKRAHELAFRNGVIATDDSFLVEVLGGSVKIIPGSRKNIKITTREDIVLATSLLNENSIVEK